MAEQKKLCKEEKTLFKKWKLSTNEENKKQYKLWHVECETVNKAS